MAPPRRPPPSSHRLAPARKAPARLLAALAAAPLTHRGHEILTLAASGLPNREIAQWLTVSVRTVENHLYRASTKLGTSDRAELAALLHCY